MIEVENNQHLDTILSSIQNKIVLILNASWNKEYKNIENEIIKLIDESEISYIAIDISNHQDISRRFRIKVTPTIILFENNKELKRLVDLKTTEQFIKFIESK